MGILDKNMSQATLGLRAMTSRCALSMEAVSAGVVQLGVEGYSPLPFLQLNAQLAFVPIVPVGGQAQAVLMTPVGPLISSMNLMGQMSVEWIAGAAFSETSQLMVGVHGWGFPGTIGGFKAAAEFQNLQVEGEELISSSTITLAVTAPRYANNQPTLSAPSWSVSAFKRTGPDHSMCAVFEAPSSGECVLTAGGTRKLDDTCRLRGKLNSKGVLALALELAGTKNLPLVGDKANITLSCEGSSVGPLNPKVGASLQLSA